LEDAGADEATTCLVVLRGELDLSQIDQVRALFPPADACSRVVIDCTAVTYIDSAIIAVFILFRRDFQKAGNNPLDMIVVASDPVDRIFEVSGMKSVLTVVRPPQSEDVSSRA
jgi:anti-anti-sigma factor